MKKGSRIGQPDAESDQDFLQACFVDSGILQIALDTTTRECILVGRTGSGKSAIIQRILNLKNNAIYISPEKLCINNIANSSIINFFEEAGVHLDTFYKLIWLHVFTIELVKKRYRVNENNDWTKVTSSLSGFIKKNKKKQAALDYINRWNDRFWVDTEYRTTEITRKVEEKLSASVDGSVLHLAKMGASGAAQLNKEQKQEVVRHGQAAIVDTEQIKQLNLVLDFLAEDVFSDRCTSYYICMDALDDDWAQDSIRFKLIKSLFETIKYFQRIPSLKIIITMRTDLIYSFFLRVTSPGFQTEKYTGYFINMKWNRNELQEIISKRIDHLFEFKYTNSRVSLVDIMPNKIAKKQNTIDYILERTFFRPREVISFFNKCLEASEGRPNITETAIKDAEYIYSSERVDAICDEWRREFPYLREFLNFIRGINDGIEVSHLMAKKLSKFSEEYSDISKKNQFFFEEESTKAFIEPDNYGLNFTQIILDVLYKTGVVGLKLSTQTRRIFSFTENIKVDLRHIDVLTKVYVHKAFWISLGIHGDINRS